MSEVNQGHRSHPVNCKDALQSALSVMQKSADILEAAAKTSRKAKLYGVSDMQEKSWRVLMAHMGTIRHEILTKYD